MTQPMDAHRARCEKVLDGLRELSALAGRVGARTLAGRLSAELADKLEQDRFHLVVVGEFNHGKTSLVNALLGERVLPVGVTPTTAFIHHVRWEPEACARVVRADGSSEELAPSELARFALGRPSQEQAERNEAPEGAAEVKAIDLGYPAELLRERILLVDTPGVNDLCLQRADITFKYIPQSDAVIFVLDAGQPLKESERLFLRDKLIGQSRDKIVFVVAKADIWSDTEREEALAYVRAELGKLLPVPPLFAVSAERALGAERAQSGVPELVAHLTTFLAEQRGRILLDNALGEGLEAARAVERSIDARRRAVQMSADELARRIAHIELDLEHQERTLEQRRGTIREEVAAIRAWARRDLDRFCDDVLEGLPAIVETEPVDELRLYLASFLERTFAEWAEAESSEIARALETLAERMVALLREDAHEAAGRLSKSAGADVPPPDLTIDTFGYDVGVFALFTLGLSMLFTNALLGGVLTIAAPVLALYLRGRVELETRQRAKEQATKAVREAVSKVAPKLDAMVTDFASRLDAWVLSAGRELHRELLDVLAAAQHSLGPTEAASAQASAQCDELAAQLAALRERLAALRAGLWDASALPSPEG